MAVIDRPALIVVVLVASGSCCLLLSVLVGRVGEGSVQAGSSGVKVSWKERTTRQLGEALESAVKDAHQVESSDSFRTSFGPYSRVHYADVNNDGETELLVEHPVGAHGRTLKAFGWIEAPLLPEFGLVGEITCGLGTPFTVGDLDDDGMTEIATVEVDWSKEGAFTAGGPYVELLYRWSNDTEKLVEVGRKEIGSPADFSKVPFTWYAWGGTSQ